MTTKAELGQIPLDFQNSGYVEHSLEDSSIGRAILAEHPSMAVDWDWSAIAPLGTGASRLLQLTEGGLMSPGLAKRYLAHFLYECLRMGFALAWDPLVFSSDPFLENDPTPRIINKREVYWRIDAEDTPAQIEKTLRRQNDVIPCFIAVYPSLDLRSCGSLKEFVASGDAGRAVAFVVLQAYDGESHLVGAARKR